jgi:RimJ/RimL family protein N-acetyltransferase
MSQDDLSGKLVRLVLLEPEKHASFYAAWSTDTEFDRLQDEDPSVVWHASQVKDFFEKNENLYAFMIQTLADDRVIGMIELQDIKWPAGDSFLGIAVGEREYWGKGYGSDALNIFLGYAFRQVGLKRVSLTVFEYNPRAIRAYEKAGFQHEGRARQALNRDGRRWDLLFMGILREEWEERQQKGEARHETSQ